MVAPLLLAALLAPAALGPPPPPPARDGGPPGEAVRPDRPGDPIRAARREGPIEVDGLLEEPAWHAAAPFDGFAQLFPEEGRPASERTEVRVLYDDQTLYVGIACHDSRPAEVSRPLGRRDNFPYSDQVGIFIDSMRDRRTAYVFFLNAAGVQSDELLFGDDQENGDWDAVWDGAVSATADGWSAELAIPLSILRFSPAASQTWGFAVKRVVARTHEESVSIQLKRGDRGIVGHFADLTGLDGLEPTQELSLAPYLAARLKARPKYDDGIRNQPRLLDPSADLGLDLRASLGRGLSLQGTLNPDFGQVEADQLQLNLSRYELFFPEKRPFFTQGLDLFQGPAPHNQPSPQQLFYSRRIGLDAPILGAAKVTGRVTDELQVGLVEAVVTGASVPTGFDADHPSRALRLDPRQPFTLAPADALPSLAPAARNFLSAVARWQPSALATFGLSGTSALPLGPRCNGPQANTDPDDASRIRPARCDVLTGNGLALDWNVRSPGGVWFLRGQASGSQYLGGLTDTQVAADGTPLATGRRRTLADGTVLRPGDLGGGAFLAFGKNGGEPWRFDVDVEWESPRLELNAVGYQRTQDELKGRAILRYVRPTGGGPFNSWAALVGGDARWSSDGAVLTSAFAFWELDVELKSFHGLSLYVDASPPAWDRREIDGAAIPLRKPGGWSANLSGWTDQGLPLSVQGNLGGGRNWPLANVRTADYWYLEGAVTWRAHDRVQTDLRIHLEKSAWSARWVDSLSGGDQLIAGLESPNLSVTLRQQLLLTPRLTLQAYAQLFTAAGRYGPYYRAAPRADGRIHTEDFVPESAPTSLPDFREAALNLSAVLRWEYRLGSTLYLVYSRAATQPEWVDTTVRPGYSLRPAGLAHGPAIDTVLLKWSWYWAA